MMAKYSSRPCRCGSGHDHYPLLDAAGIFCAYVCEACEPERRKKYDPAIFDSRRAYAATGNEEDIDQNRW
jgi:hypothetical protein